jgi:hypothetical protein
MGWETANIHLGQQARDVRRDLARRPPRWLEKTAATMADLVEKDWREWVKRK